ncbi:MAG: hypothetical protein CMJ25_11045 [Phycisphaerae bacterium]|nr:hypothetical protein [Phycisphaerae bacterium]|tara:strand:+ start:355 stop:2685 length:2331 start_codon:yes stop_codon:yes gene_type:complete
MAKLGDLVVRVGADTVPLNTALGNVKKTLRNETGNIQKLGRNMSMAITAPLVAIGATSFKIAADFEQSMAKVKAVSGATGEEFKSLQDNAKELGRTTRFTASEVSGLQLEFAKLGFTAQEITEVTEATLNLAQATGSDLAQSAEVAGSTMRAFGINVSETARVTDVMAAAFSNSALDMDLFQDSMKFVAPVAKNAGVSLEEASAMLGVLADNGIKGSTAGTSLRRILMEVAGTGQPFAEAMKKSADEVINLADAKDEVGRTASSAFLVLKEGMKDVDALTESLFASKGAAAAMAAVMDDTAEGAMKRMQSAIEGAQIEIGAMLAPVMVVLAGIVADLAGKISEMSDGTRIMVSILLAIPAVIGPILLILPSLTAGLESAKLAFSGLNTTMRANPFGVVATAITLVVTGIMLLKDETVKAVTAVEALTEANKNLTLEEQKRNIEVQIEQQKKLVAELEAEKAAKDAIVAEGYGGKAKKEQNEATTAYLAATGQLEKMGEMLAEVNSKLEGTGDGSNEAAGGTKTLTLEMVKASKAAFDLKQELDKLGTQKSELFEGEPIDLNKAFFGDTAGADLGIDLGLDEFSEEFDEAFNIDDGTEAMVRNFDKMKEAATSSMMKAIEVSNAFGMAFGAAVADVVSGEKTASEALKSLAMSAIRSLIQMAKMNVIANATSPTNPVNLFSGGLSSPAFIVAGLSMLDGFIGGLTAFADGGIVSGPTLGLVGEYPGAKTNPEVIAPLDKLRSMMGGQHVQVTGKISGRDILLTSERNAIDRNRVRGF